MRTKMEDIFPDFELYYKATAIKTLIVAYKQKNAPII